jgi:hypothetical protein
LCPGCPPGFRPLGVFFGGNIASEKSLDGGFVEFPEFWFKSASSRATNSSNYQSPSRNLSFSSKASSKAFGGSDIPRLLCLHRRTSQISALFIFRSAAPNPAQPSERLQAFYIGYPRNWKNLGTTMRNGIK